MRRVLTVAVILGACLAAIVLTGASDDSSKGSKTVKILFDNAFGLTEGGDLKVAGTRVGSTDKFTLTDDEPPKAVVEAKITEPGFDSFRKDATCETRPQSLIGEYYVDCQPGSSKEELPNDTVPVSQTSSTIPPDLLNNVLRRPYRERLRLIIAELGAGLAGRPDDLNDVIRRAHPGLRETSKTLRILGRQNRVIQDFIVNSDTVVAALEKKKKEVARFVTEAGKAAQISASRDSELAAGFNRLPRVLGELKPTMKTLGDLADEQTPLLRDLRTAAPDLLAFFGELGPFAEASRPAFRSLGKASVAGTRALNESRDEIDELRKLAVNAPAMGKPLRQILQTLDDRSRSIESDPRAKETAPPAPDPAAFHNGQGFTGFESLLNYVYWQTLALNGFDDVGHLLRSIGIESECGNYFVKSQLDPPAGETAASIKATYDRCNSWLGPNQIGINVPDPTASGKNAPANPQPASTRARKVGERRSAGQPEAAPLPGQKDISKPQIVLPPQVQQLIDKLTTPVNKLPGALRRGVGGGSSGGDSPAQLLDFLLAP